MLVSSSEDGTIIIWDLTTRQLLGQRLEGLTYYSIAFSPDSKMLASGGCGKFRSGSLSCQQKEIRLWDMATRQQIGQPLHTEAVFSVDFSPDGKTLVSGSQDGTILLWDITTRQQIGQPLTGHTEPVTSVAFSPDGKILALGNHNGKIVLWDVATHQNIGVLTNYTSVVRVAFSPDGKLLILGSDDGTISLWDVAMRKQLSKPLKGQTDLGESVDFSLDWKTLASGGDDGTIVLWDVMTYQELGTLTDPMRNVSSLAFTPSMAFSPDGKTLASGTSDHRIILWDVVTLQMLGQLLIDHNVGIPPRVAFSPDGKTLASATHLNDIILWDVDMKSWQARACNIVARNLTQAEWKQYFGNEPYHKTCEQWPEGE
jgi:WD40 repeat protein